MCFAAVVNAAGYNKSSDVVASGATSAANSSLRLQGTVGQAVIGASRNANTINGQGFWHNVTSQTSSVAQPSAMLADFSLDQNYPNPFQSGTTIRFTANTTANVTLKVYDMAGKLVTTLLSSSVTPGAYVIQYDANMLPSGAYIYALESQGHSLTKTLTILH